MRCPECGSHKYQELGSEIICTQCGLVLEELLIEKNDYLAESKKTNAQPPSLIKAGGRKVDGRIVKDTWLYSTQQKNLEASFQTIELLGSKLSMPQKAVQEAKILYQQAIHKNLNKGRDNTTIAYASTYLACTLYHIPKTPLEIVIHTSVSRVKMLRYAKLLAKELEIIPTITDPADLIPRIATRLQSQQITITKAIEIVEMIKESNITAGRKPETTAAAAMYLAGIMMNDKKTQREVANATGVLEVTIRRRSREIQAIIVSKIYNSE